MIAYSFEFEVFKGKVYANFQIKDRIHKFEGEWNANHHLIVIITLYWELINRRDQFWWDPHRTLWKNRQFRVGCLQPLWISI